MVSLVIFYSLQSCYFNIVCLANEEGSLAESCLQNTKLHIPQSHGSLWHYWQDLSYKLKFVIPASLIKKQNRMNRVFFFTYSVQNDENMILNSKEFKHFKKGWRGWMWCYIFPEVRNYCESVLIKVSKSKAWLLFYLYSYCSTCFCFRLCKSWVTKKLHK